MNEAPIHIVPYDPALRTHHLHLIPNERPLWRDRLMKSPFIARALLRSTLRGHGE